MNYTDFETLISVPRCHRYFVASGNDAKKTMELYRANLNLAKALFAVLSVFEVVLRNKIDSHYKPIYNPVFNSNEWLSYAVKPGGFYDIPQCYNTKASIIKEIHDLKTNYTHDKLLAELNFGFWRFQFAAKEFRAAGSTLHRIFVNRPKGTNHTDIFKKLTFLNNIRNRIAHHEPICFGTGNTISTIYALNHYNTILELLQWLDINSSDMLLGVDKVLQEIDIIDNL